MFRSSVLLFLCLTAYCEAHQIEHVVVAMLENRAFDHMLGWMSLGGPFGDTRVDGLRGDECNDKNLTNSSEGRFCVNDEALDHCPYDPNHSFDATTERIFGCEWNKTEGTCDSVPFNLLIMPTLLPDPDIMIHRRDAMHRYSNDEWVQ